MTRIKENYESRSRILLTRRTPVIIRLDGKAFHTYTRSLNKPFDEGLIEDMQRTAAYLCENIQNVKCAYVQSDEISLLLTDYDNLQSESWFDYNIQKMTSISASLATAKFNQLRLLRELKESNFEMSVGDIGYQTLANFDSRVFNIPKEEVSNYFLARQKDAVKNSINMLAQSLYTHGKPNSELYGKNSDQMQEMCFQKGYNWNDLPFEQKRGSFIIKNTYINDELCKVYPNYIIGIKEDFNKLEFYPKNCREDITEDICRRYIPIYEEGSGVKIKYGGADKDIKGNPQKQWMKPKETSEQATDRLASFVEASDFKGREQSAFIDKNGKSEEVKLRNDDGKWNWYYEKSKKPFASFDSAKDAITFIQKQPFWDNGELNKNGRDDAYFAKAKAEHIKTELENGNILEDINDGKISAKDAKGIIENAGLKVPKEIQGLAKKESKQPNIKEEAPKQPTDVSKEEGSGYRDNFENIKIEKIRTKWEVVETPLRFNEQIFKQWL